jgi:hypothetical protein
MSLLKSVMMLAACGAAVPALADGPPAASPGPQPIAVFPFTIQDTSGSPAPGQKERLETATKELSDTLAATGLYKPVDLAPYAKQIATMQPPDECGECWAELAKKAGANFEVIPSVQKVSVLISQMTMWFADVRTMKYSRLVQGQIRGDTAEAYSRGIDFLVHEELLKKRS